MIDRTSPLKPICLVIFLAFFISCIPYLNPYSKDHLVRVAVIGGADSVTVSGRLGKKYRTGYGVSLRDTLPLFFSPQDGRVTVNDLPFRGNLEIRRNGNELWAINVVSMEDYLKGVVPCEIGGINKNLAEAAKAQAVAARTYAYAHQGQHSDLGFDLYATVQDQVYSGLRAEDDLTNQAVDDTRGQILVFQGRPIEAKYHSTCGGRTADYSDAWPGAAPPYLKSVTCDYCRPSPHYGWEKTCAKRDFFINLRNRLGRLGITLGEREFIKGLRLLKNRRSQRIRQITILTTKNEYKIQAYNIRTLLGDNRDPGGLLKSSYFQFKVRGDTIAIEGHGFGHGVGMCQWGALEMSRKGKNYRQILRLYYPGTIIKNR
jgi:stage II sporulation protein D